MLLGCSLIIMLGSILWWKFVFHGHVDGYSKVKSIPILFLLIVCVSSCTDYIVSNKMVLDVHKHTYCIYFCTFWILFCIKFSFHDDAIKTAFQFFNSDSMRMMVYITYGPLNGLCLLLALLEIKLVLMPIISRWKMLNQEIVVLPYSSRSKSLSDYTSTNSTSGSRTTVDPRDVSMKNYVRWWNHFLVLLKR